MRCFYLAFPIRETVSLECLIPADGFNEWNSEDGKQPYFIHRKDNTPLALAGLWDHWDA